MAAVTVPAEFFRAELRVYSDWREAFCRELLQNSIDADPSHIDVAFDTADGHGRVVFSDDGRGMTRQILEDVFFALGRTTKTDAGSIGGFGRARIIICFAQTRYRIRTGRLMVEGSGGEYRVSELDDYRPGCEFSIDLLDETPQQVKESMRHLLSLCTLNVPVHIDGHLSPGRQMPARAARVLRDGQGRPWAKVFQQPGAGQLTVRVHGLVMFRRWLSGYDDVILELSASRSRDVLSASRDQLHAEYLEQVDKFIADLSQNRRRALSASDSPLDLCVGGGGFLRTDAPPAGPSRAEVNSASEPAVTGPLSGVAVTAANAAAASKVAPSPFAAGQARPAPTGGRLGFDVYLLAESNTPRVRRLARMWDPSTWTATSGRRRRALLLCWKAAVAGTLDTFVRLHPGLGDVVWTVGWTFDEDVKALHRAAGRAHVFALNPVDGAGKTTFNVSARADRQRLISLAAHEVCHSAHDTHDERFASLLTDLFAALSPPEIDKQMRVAARAATH